MLVVSDGRKQALYFQANICKVLCTGQIISTNSNMFLFCFLKEWSNFFIRLIKISPAVARLHRRQQKCHLITRMKNEHEIRITIMMKVLSEKDRRNQITHAQTYKFNNNLMYIEKRRYSETVAVL